MNEAGFEGPSPPVATPPAENLIKLETTVPAENVSARPAETPSPAAASPSETPAPAQPQSLGEQVTGESAIQATAETTPPVKIRENVEKLMTTVDAKLNGQLATPENITQALVAAQAEVTGQTPEEAAKEVEIFKQTQATRLKQLLMAGVEGFQKQMATGAGIRLENLLDALLVGSRDTFGFGGGEGFELEDREKNLTMDDFKDLLQNKNKHGELAAALQRACKSGEWALFNNNFGTESDRKQIEEKLNSGQPADLLFVLNKLCGFLFDNDQTEFKTKRWQLVKRQLGAALTDNRKTLSDEIYKQILSPPNYNQRDRTNQELAKLLGVEAVTSDTKSNTSTNTAAPSETSGSAAPEAAA